MKKINVTGLDLSAAIVNLDPREIRGWQEVDQEKVDAIAEAMDEAGRKIATARGQSGYTPAWPAKMPKVVVGALPHGGCVIYEVADGHHRVAAAIRAGLGSIPVIVLDGRALLYLNRLPSTNHTMKEFAKHSRVMADNQRLRIKSGEDIS
jgi:membrane-associated protease RseP (regulator of RpoE activity)